MAQTTEWEAEKYREVFDEELRGLERRFQSNPSSPIDDVKGILENLYIFQGQDWTGRGPVANTAIEAQIDAYETFLHSWEKAHKS